MPPRFRPFAFVPWIVLCSAGAIADELLIADFEQPTYGEWTVTGDAFGDGPAAGTLANQMAVRGHEGKGLVNSFLHGDGSKGTLTSPSFTIQRDYINFLVGGGKFPGETCINLLVDGGVVRTATGPNDKPGGSEELSWQAWDVREWLGTSAGIEIVDARTGGWGHINVDEIHQSNQKVMQHMQREIVIDKEYLNFPVLHGASRRKVEIAVDGEKVREFDIELADGQPDYWVSLHVGDWHGRTLVMNVAPARRSMTAIQAIYLADVQAEAESFYREANRQQFHFSSRRGWNNDPNGMVYYDGEYHLFYQHNPFGWDWGNMTWGHAISPDMVHWEELDDAIHPDALGTIFSGGAVVDERDTAGFQTGNEKPIVCFYTSAGGENAWSEGQPFTQSLAYSNDRGRTWTKYPGNPIIGHIRGGNRDPKVIWHEPTRRWVMVLFVEDHAMDFFTSSNLKTWEFQSRLKSFHECPELFELPVDGDSGDTRWVLYGAHGQYFLGSFDGKAFTPEGEELTFNWGNCFYASQTFSQTPDGRRVQIAWGRIATPGMPFNQCMLFPVELTLKTTEEGVRMTAVPVAEVTSLHKVSHRMRAFALDGVQALDQAAGELFHITIEVEPGVSTAFGFEIRGTRVIYDVENQVLSCRDRSASLAPSDGVIHLELLVDRNSIEIFGNRGEVYMPMGGILPTDNRTLRLYSEGGEMNVNLLDVIELDSIWGVPR